MSARKRARRAADEREGVLASAAAVASDVAALVAMIARPSDTFLEPCQRAFAATRTTVRALRRQWRGARRRERELDASVRTLYELFLATDREYRARRMPRALVRLRSSARALERACSKALAQLETRRASRKRSTGVLEADEDEDEDEDDGGETSADRAFIDCAPVPASAAPRARAAVLRDECALEALEARASERALALSSALAMDFHDEARRVRTAFVRLLEYALVLDGDMEARALEGAVSALRAAAVEYEACMRVLEEHEPDATAYTTSARHDVLSEFVARLERAGPSGAALVTALAAYARRTLAEVRAHGAAFTRALLALEQAAVALSDASERTRTAGHDSYASEQQRAEWAAALAPASTPALGRYSAARRR